MLVVSCRGLQRTETLHCSSLLPLLPLLPLLSLRPQPFLALLEIDLRRRKNAMVRLSAFQPMPFQNAARYDPVTSKIFPDIHPPSAMPKSVHMITAPTSAPVRAAGKFSRTMIAADRTMPPWERPKSARIP